VLLAKITLDNLYYPNNEGLKVLAQIFNYLKGYPKATIRIVNYYTNKTGQKQAMLEAENLKNYLQKQFPNYNNSQVRFETKERILQKSSKKSYSILIQLSPFQSAVKYADVFGTGFPENFSEQLKPKASAN
nr:hypothetical protein [Chitinophagaceae bacterium]